MSVKPQHLAGVPLSMKDSDPLLPRSKSDSTFSSYNSEPVSPYPNGFSESSQEGIGQVNRAQLGQFASASSVCMVFLSMAVHGIFSGQIPHWQIVLGLSQAEIGMLEYVFFVSVFLGVILLYVLRNIDYNLVFPAMFCSLAVAVVAGLLTNPNPSFPLVTTCRIINGFAAGFSMASVTPDLIAPVLLFSSTSVLVGSSLSSLFFEMFNSGPNLQASLDSTPTLILLLIPVFVASLAFIFFLTWFLRFFVGPMCPAIHEQEQTVDNSCDAVASATNGSRILHAGSAFAQGVIIGTILSAFPILQSLDASFFGPIGICHNAYLVIIIGKLAAQPTGNMLSRIHPSSAASVGFLMVAVGFLMLTFKQQSCFSVVASLFCIGSGSSLLSFSSATMYWQERFCNSNSRSVLTPIVVEFISLYFLGVSCASCFAALKFSGLVVRAPAHPQLICFFFSYISAGGSQRSPFDRVRCYVVIETSKFIVRSTFLRAWCIR
jgi:hypothetical protein